MTAAPLVRYRPLLGFALLLVAFVGAEFLVIQRSDFTFRPALPAAVSFDLLVLLPGLFYWLVVRPCRLPVSTVAAAFTAAVALAFWLLPPPQQTYVHWAKHSLVAVEALMLTLALLNLRRLRRAYRVAAEETPDVVANLQTAFQSVFGRPLTPLVSEISLFYYALLSWRARPEIRPADQVFTAYRDSAFTAYLGTVGLLSVVEMGVAHVLLVRWSPIAALVGAGLHAYGLLLLLAHLRAVRLRPVRLTEAGELVVRVGFLWELRLPAAAVAASVLIPDVPPAAPGLVNAARLLLTPPNLLLTLHEPHMARGPYGFPQQVRRLALYLDNPQVFQASLAQYAPVASGPASGNKA
ncbi:hypothetical protein [Hymenobacter rubripertinctus]|uniref:Uncharacterized protein n=1 Tax=Hymenobacter rubripertinctus TaxID=2029981 RepID=A0A418R5E8_9BACT|nr:hypothetical protein [Hymenobacter rubripertinctus]RIY12790.1 hypothetical protein D0T11_03445 [Hymenobacter rubripertinctus]